MGDLYHNLSGERVVDITIMEVLTLERDRTSVSVCRQGTNIRDIIGINSVTNGRPRSLFDGWYERAVFDFDTNTGLYLIDADMRILGITREPVDLFYDADKVQDKNRFVWVGSFKEIIEQFVSRGYIIRYI